MTAAIVTPMVGYDVAEVMEHKGQPVRHADFERRRREARGETVTKLDIERDVDLQCAGWMARHGVRVADEHDGHTVIHWEGSALFTTWTCSSCGAEWTTDTRYRRQQAEAKKEVEPDDPSKW